ncbi:uncharacterized protein LOC119683994 [Teleopsis dalmanni]|uniref:uncharacterized protein LOC119683994 n=1 Tax=Teleopsis dalmanni TaxID=139649 RepID=UPI0018CFEA06|nr:uncharacterized protein LOC119683994 [Teleopsis dalmanni]
MPSLNKMNLILITIILASGRAPKLLVKAFVTNTNAIADTSHPPTSSLASKVIYQSPLMEKIYKEFIVSSKPLSLRKYSSGLKQKKTKKDSRIYYIPIPPSPYRYIAGVGYDYQPMKINPIMKDTYPIAGGASQKHHHHHHHYYQPYMPFVPTYPNTVKPLVNVDSSTMSSTSGNSNINKNNRIDTAVSGTNGESKLHRLQRGDYLFNGRPFRLQVAHAKPKHQITPQNLKSKLYFNKNFIY